MALEERGLRERGIVHPRIAESVDGLAGYLLLSLGAIIGLLAVITVVTTAYVITVREGSPGMPAGIRFLAAGSGFAVTMAIVWMWVDAPDRSVAFPFRSPSRAEVGWAVACVPLGIAAFTLGTEAATALGFEYRAFDYDLTDPLTIAGVLIGPLLLAPIVEEALFRGLLLGSLLDRGLSLWLAGLVSILLFLGGHLWLGAAGAVGIAAWAVFPTLLRLRFNNLTGATLLNNLVAYVVLVAVPR